MFFWVAVLGMAIRSVPAPGPGDGWDRCSPKSAEWLSVPRSGNRGVHHEVLSLVRDGKAVKAHLPAGHFRVLVAPIHRWDLVAAIQLLERSPKGRAFLMPRLEWSEDRLVAGPSVQGFDRSRLGDGVWHLVLITRAEQRAERLVWGRVMVSGSLRIAKLGTSRGILVALFGANGPAPGEPVEILDESGAILVSGNTGADGTFFANLHLRRRAVIVAGGEGRQALAMIEPRSRDGEPCRFLRLWVGARHAVGPGDDLALAGVLLMPGSPASSLQVVVEEAGSPGRVVGHLRVSRQGLFGGTVRLPRDLAPGKVMLRIGRGRCERLTWLSLEDPGRAPGPRLWLSPGSGGLEVHLDLHRTWLAGQSGRFRLQWGWSRTCGSEPFAGGTAEACLDSRGRGIAALSIPEGGRCLWVRALAQNQAGRHRVQAWWPAGETFAIEDLDREAGWFLARPGLVTDRIHLDDGSSWNCVPGFGFSLCPFRLSGPGVRLAWVEKVVVGGRLWAWAERPAPAATSASRAMGRLPVRVRRKGRRLSIRIGWNPAGGPGLVALDWAGRLVYRLFSEVRGRSDLSLALPDGALGPVSVFAGQVLEGRQIEGAEEVFVDPAPVWHVSPPGSVVRPSGRVCVEATGAGSFLALMGRSMFRVAGDPGGHHGVLVGASGLRPSVCLAAPDQAGAFSLRAAGVIAKQLSWIEETMTVAETGVSISGPDWLRMGDSFCLKWSGTLPARVTYRLLGVGRIGRWPDIVRDGAVLCGRVTGDAPQVVVEDSQGEVAVWSASLRPPASGPLTVSQAAAPGLGGWICAGRRCPLLPILVRMASQPARDGASIVAGLLAWTALREVVPRPILRRWLSGSVRSLSGAGLDFSSGALRLLKSWMGPEGLVQASAFGKTARPEVQASAVWALVRLGRRHEAAAIAEPLKDRQVALGSGCRLCALWALLETGLPPGRDLPGGGSLGALALRLWAASRTGRPLSVLDRLLDEIRRALSVQKTGGRSMAMFEGSLALLVLDELLPGHGEGERLARRLARDLFAGRGGLTTRSLAALALWEHWDSALVQTVAVDERGQRRSMPLRCDAAVAPLEPWRRAVLGQPARIRPRCPLYRVFRRTGPVQGDGALEWIVPGVLSGPSPMGLVIAAKRALLRPCIRIPLPSGSRLTFLYEDGLGILPAFPWEVAHRSSRGLLVCGPSHLPPGLYGLSFDVHPTAAGRYGTGGACLTDVGGLLGCTGSWELRVSKENP